MDFAPDMLRHAKRRCQGIDGSSRMRHEREFRDFQGLTDCIHVVLHHLLAGIFMKDYMRHHHLPGQLRGVLVPSV